MIQLNGIEVKFEKFPNGETKFETNQLITLNYNRVVFRYESDAELINLLFIKKFLDNMGGSVELIIAYMPYSRMDRVEGEIFFTLKYVCEFINDLMFDEVVVIESHSDVTTALLDRCDAISPIPELLIKVNKEVNFGLDDYIFFPDAGAQKRYSKLLRNINMAVGYKERNFQTGKIEKMSVVGADNIKGKKVIIVDDLCSYGGTFFGIDENGNKFGAAAELKKLGASEIYLLIVHCEYSIFKGKLLQSNSPIDKVFTTNTILDKEVESDNLHVFELGELND